jgi:hypothetical protein
VVERVAFVIAEGPDGGPAGRAVDIIQQEAPAWFTAFDRATKGQVVLEMAGNPFVVRVPGDFASLDISPVAIARAAPLSANTNFVVLIGAGMATAVPACRCASWGIRVGPHAVAFGLPNGTREIIGLSSTAELQQPTEAFRLAHEVAHAWCCSRGIDGMHWGSGDPRDPMVLGAPEEPNFVFSPKTLATIPHHFPEDPNG